MPVSPAWSCRGPDPARAPATGPGNGAPVDQPHCRTGCMVRRLEASAPCGPRLRRSLSGRPMVGVRPVQLAAADWPGRGRVRRCPVPWRGPRRLRRLPRHSRSRPAAAGAFAHQPIPGRDLYRQRNHYVPEIWSVHRVKIWRIDIANWKGAGDRRHRIWQHKTVDVNCVSADVREMARAVCNLWPRLCIDLPTGGPRGARCVRPGVAICVDPAHAPVRWRCIDPAATFGSCPLWVIRIIA